MVIATAAYCGSGQDTLADGFCQHRGFIRFSLGDVIREIADRRSLKHTRKNLQNIRIELDGKFGRNFIPDTIVEKVRNASQENIILTGLRTEVEYQIFKDKLGAILVFVKADEGIRLQRMLRRGSEKDECSVSLLLKRMAREEQIFDYKILDQLADYHFDFNMSLCDYKRNEINIISELYRQIAFNIECEALI